MVEPPLQFIIFADVINSCNACLCTIFNNVEPFCSKRLQENVVSDRNWMVATLCMAGINLLFSVTDDISCSLFAPFEPFVINYTHFELNKGRVQNCGKFH